jgi:hypothetical protein
MYLPMSDQEMVADPSLHVHEKAGGEDNLGENSFEPVHQGSCSS